MCSFSEFKVAKCLAPSNFRPFIRYHRDKFTRVYPKGARVDSSNYDPVKLWNLGIQLVALNYQTPDKAMQLNQAKFRQYGYCGYILRPEFMFTDDYDPFSLSSIGNVEKLTFYLKIIAARHLTKTSNKGYVSPLVEVEVIGADYDYFKAKTNTIRDNGLNPVWNESFVFEINNPDLAFLRFVVNDEDVFSDEKFLAQACFPVRCLRQGKKSSLTQVNYYFYFHLLLYLFLGILISFSL